MAQSLTVRVGANIDDLKKALDEGKVVIVNTSSAMDKLASRLGGDKAKQEAEKWAGAIAKIGSATQLTAKDQEKANLVMSRAIDYYKTQGTEAPKAYRDIEAATRKATQATEAHGISFGKLVGSFITAQAAMALVTRGYREVKQFVGESIQAYAQQEAAVAKLTAAMKAQGTATPELIGQYQALASQFQRTTVYGDELTMEMQALLIQVGNVMPNEMNRALQASMDLASGLGIDLRTATQLVGKAFAGETGTLTRYGIVIDETKLKTEGIGAVMDALQARFGGQAAAQLDTYAGRVAQLSNYWGDFKEKVGEAFVTSSLVQDLLKAAPGIIESATVALDRLNVGYLAVRGGAYALAQGVAEGIKWLGLFMQRALEMQRTLNPLSNLFGQVDKQIAEWADRTAVATIAADVFGRNVKHIQEEMIGLMAGGQKAGTAVRGLGDELRGADAWAKIAAANAKDHAKALAEAAKAAEKFRDACKSLKIGGYGILLDDIPDLTRRTDEFREALDRLEPTDSFAGIAKTLPTVTGNLADATQAVDDLAAAMPKAVKGFLGGETAARSFGQAVEDVFTGLPDIIMAAVTGGGDIGRSIGASIGRQLGQALADSLSNVLAKAFGTKLGASIGKAIPVVGELLGTLLGPVFDKIGGWITKAAGKKANDLRDQFISAAGGLHALNVKAVEAGMNLNALLAAKDEKGLQRAIADLEAGLARFDARVKGVASSLGQIGATGGLLTKSILAEIESLKTNPEIRAALADFIQAQTSRGMAALGAIAASGGAFTAAGAAGVGAGAAALFAQLQEEGLSLAEITAQMGPVIADLAAQFAAAGLSGGAAFKALAGQMAYLQDDGVAPLLSGAQGITDLMTSLANLGRLNEGTFADLAAQVRATAVELELQGKGGEEMFQAMQPQLQRIWELQQQFKWEVDESTQAMLDQAEASGQIGDQFRPAADKMITAIDRLVTRLGSFINTLMGLPDEAGEAAGGIERVFGDLKIPPIKIPYQYEYAGDLNLPPPPDEVPQFARGGLVTRPTFAVVGEAGPEAIIPLDQLRRLETGMDATGGAPPLNLEMNFYGVQKERWIRDEIMPGVLAVLRKGGGTLTDWQATLGVN